ncbi:hypothetical protein Taro_056724, partial [Colocasia esculenta]|nr:hypothetical protein [Colocasia esculenta]
SKRTKGLEEEEEEEEEEEAGWGGGWRRWRRPAAVEEEAAGAGGWGSTLACFPGCPKPAKYGVLGWDRGTKGGSRRIATDRPLSVLMFLHLMASMDLFKFGTSSSSLKCVLECPGKGIEWVRWYPRGLLVLGGSEHSTVWMWNADKNAYLNVFSGHGGSVTCGDFTLDVENFMETQASEAARIGVSDEDVDKGLKSTLLLIKWRWMTDIAREVKSDAAKKGVSEQSEA